MVIIVEGRASQRLPVMLTLHIIELYYLKCIVIVIG